MESQIVMEDLLSFQRERIEALEKKVKVYEVWLLEVIDRDCPQEYREIIKKQLLDR